MTYLYRKKEYDSLFELAKVMFLDSEYFSKELRKGTLLDFIAEKDPDKAEKVKKLSPLSYPDDVFVFLASYVLNPYMSFRIGKHVFSTYKEMGESMLSYAPNMNNVLLHIVSYQLLSHHMISTLYAKEHPKMLKEVMRIEKEAERNREKAYFSLAYFLSGKKTIIYKGVEYKDIYNLTHYLMQQEPNLDALGTYLSTSPLIEAYKDYSSAKQELDVYFHVVESYDRDRRNLDDFLKRKKERERNYIPYGNP